MITLDTSAIARIDEESLEEKIEDRAKILYLKPQDVQFTPKYKKKGRSSASNKVGFLDFKEIFLCFELHTVESIATVCLFWARPVNNADQHHSRWQQLQPATRC